jgi:predicted amidophosphoribosyltransferase
MATLTELSEPYAEFMLGPRPGPGVCGVCFNLTDGWRRCWACAHGGRCLDVVSPISYSVAGDRLHQALVAYKRDAGPWIDRLGAELAAVLWRHLESHEHCLACAAGGGGFELVTTVPSSERARDEAHPLHRLVGDVIGPTKDRYRRLLRRSAEAAQPHVFSPTRFEPRASLHGEAVLLIDDTWTMGANAQSAAAALKRAGAGPVAALVIGRHLNRGWHENETRIRSFERPFDWTSCSRCRPSKIRGLEQSTARV